MDGGYWGLATCGSRCESRDVGCWGSARCDERLKGRRPLSIPAAFVKAGETFVAKS
ncbi:MAG: hypothetical protein LBM98_07580 [Oscillospiraceae bacterium]|nr:hypothetical protein [Oscillospiraceae bacterium]